MIGSLELLKIIIQSNFAFTASNALSFFKDNSNNNAGPLSYISNSFNVTCRSSSTVICLIVQSAVRSTYSSSYYCYILLLQNFNFSKCTMTKLHPKLYTINLLWIMRLRSKLIFRRFHISWPLKWFFWMTIFSILRNLFYLRSSVIF